nr:hypothetical protein [Tanacetum cinerariifolium]
MSIEDLPPDLIPQGRWFDSARGLYIPSATSAADVAATWTCGTQSADVALLRRLTWVQHADPVDPPVDWRSITLDGGPVVVNGGPEVVNDGQPPLTADRHRRSLPLTGGPQIQGPDVRGLEFVQGSDGSRGSVPSINPDGSRMGTCHPLIGGSSCKKLAVMKAVQEISYDALFTRSSIRNYQTTPELDLLLVGALN